jgi:hypothetical protein
MSAHRFRYAANGTGHERAGGDPFARHSALWRPCPVSLNMAPMNSRNARNELLIGIGSISI